MTEVFDIMLEISKKVGGIMKFQRINDDTIRCIVYKQDMQEFGIVLEDFFKNKGKVHEFLHEIVERAEQEIGYTPKEGMLSMQIIPINPNTLSITFSDNSGESYEDIISNLKDTMGVDIDSELLMDEEGPFVGPDCDEVKDSLDSNISDEPRLPNDSKDIIRNGITHHGMEKSSIILIGMTKLDKMARFCKAIDINKTVSSELYYMQNKDMYCLVIEKNRLSEMDMKKLLMFAVEYTSNITDESKIISHVREYGEPIIEKSAYRILRKYV